MKNTAKNSIILPLSAGIFATVIAVAGASISNTAYASESSTISSSQSSSPSQSPDVAESHNSNSDSETVHFEDDNLKNAVLDYLKNGKNSSSWSSNASEDGKSLIDSNAKEITVEQAKKIKRLNLENKSISNIAGLEKFTNLENLALSNNNITDISTIKNLSNLHIAYFGYNKITDISALSSLPNIDTINFSNNQISDISPIKDLSNLDDMNFSSNAGIGSKEHLEANTEVLRNLKSKDKLKYISLDEINLGDNGVSFVKNLPNLEIFSAYKAGISDVSVFKDSPKLYRLVLGSNNITDISKLSSLVNLNYLDLCYNKNISDISVLSSLNKLETLYLHVNNISDISALRGLSNLTTLEISNNKISDISALKDLNNLKSLYITNNKITDFSSLTKLKNIDFHEDNLGMQYFYLALPSSSIEVTAPDVVKAPSDEYEIGYGPNHQPGRNRMFKAEKKHNAGALRFLIKKKSATAWDNNHAFGGCYYFLWDKNQVSSLDKRDGAQLADAQVIAALNLGENTKNYEKAVVSNGNDDYEKYVTITYKSGFVSKNMVPIRLITTSSIDPVMRYVADPDAEYDIKTVEKELGAKGSKETIRFKNSEGKVVSEVNVTKSAEDGLTKVGNKKIVVVPIAYKTIVRENSDLPFGVVKIIQKGSDGSIVTTTVYEVDPLNGELSNGKDTVTVVDATDEIREVGTNLDSQTSIPTDFGILPVLDNVFNSNATQISGDSTCRNECMENTKNSKNIDVNAKVAKTKKSYILPKTGSNASGTTFASFGAMVLGLFAASGAAVNRKRAKHLR